jgi:hypothetical protein
MSVASQFVQRPDIQIEGKEFESTHTYGLRSDDIFMSHACSGAHPIVLFISVFWRNFRCARYFPTVSVAAKVGTGAYRGSRQPCQADAALLSFGKDTCCSIVSDNVISIVVAVVVVSKEVVEKVSGF